MTDQNGKVLTYAEGERESVRIPPGQGHLLNGAIVTHNHPGVASFSPNDLGVAMSHHVREIRAVDDVYEYSLKPGRVAWDRDYFEQVALPEYERIEAVVIGKLNDALSAGHIDEQTYFNSRDHLIMRKLSRAVGLKYRRIKRAASRD